jgi:uncharacterized cupredoxin-like copper-binding protein
VRAPFSLPRLATALSAGVLALALAGCSGDASTATGSSAATGGGPASSATAPEAGGSSAASQSVPDTAAATTVTAIESEFAIDLSRKALPAGTYAVTVTNSGKGTHSLTIEGPGGVDVTSKTLHGGESTTMTVTLQPGTYEVYCPIGNHRSMGMDTSLTVS